MAHGSVSGKRILLTGASSGIGWCLASQLVREGARLVVTSRRSDRLEQLRLALGNPSKLLAVPGDVSDSGHRQRLISTVLEQFGGIDILINNAGIGAVGNFESATSERLRRIFEVDFFAVAELTRLAIPHLKQGDRPAICLVGSVLGHRAVPGKSEYCAAKFALRGWAESLRVELKPYLIDVLMISPSTTRSEFFDSLIESADKGPTPSIFGAQSAERVARSILKALKLRKRDTILSPGGKALVWLGCLAPELLDRLLLRYAG